MAAKIIVLSLLTGLITGAVFGYLQIPIPAPPKLAGITGIVGIFIGYKLINLLDWGFNLLEALGI